MRSAILPLILIFLFISSNNQAQNLNVEKPDKWQQIDSLMELGLYDTSKPAIHELYLRSKAEDNINDYIKSVFYKLKIYKTEDDADINTLSQFLEGEIKESVSPQTELLHSILAEVYIHYYRQKRWEILQRKKVLNTDLEDINQWSNTDFKHRIKFHSKQSIKNKEILFNTKINTLNAILSIDDVNATNKPSLLDFLADRLIKHFTFIELIAAPQIKSDDKYNYLLPYEKFIEQDLDSLKSTNSIYYILDLYKQLLAFHLENEIEEPIIQIDIERLKFVRDYFLRDEKYDSNYLNALNNIITAFPEHPKTAEVEYKKAMVYTVRGRKYNPFSALAYQWEFKKALDICNAAIKKFPQSNGAKYCQGMQKRLLSKLASIQMKSVQLPHKPILASIEYRNCDQLFFKLIKLPYKNEQNSFHHSNQDEQLNFYLKQKAIEEWVQDMPNLGDLQNHNIQIPLPELQKGFYVMLISSNESFNKENLLCQTNFLVSNLSYIKRNDGNAGSDIYVLDRSNGHALANVKLDVYSTRFDYSKRERISTKEKTYYSDKNGFIHINPSRSSGSKRYVLSLEKDTLIENNIYRSFVDKSMDYSSTTHFFTDRNIYRPGQVVYFKGINVGTNNKIPSLLTDQFLLVELYDVNHQKLESKSLVSNNFGSFSASFVIPKNALNGRYSLKVGNRYHYFSVEEYKRPSFEVVYDDIETQYSLNDTVEISGYVKSFSGAKLNNANIDFLIRMNEFHFYEYNLYRNQVSGKIIESGELITDEDGAFKFKFFAEAGEFSSLMNDIVCNFYIQFKITDSNGETLSFSKTLPISNTNLYLNCDIPKIVEKNSLNNISIQSENLSGKLYPANVSVSIYKLLPQEKAFKERSWQRPDQFIMDKETFYSYFPNELYDNESDISNWVVENQVFQAEINTGESTLLDINNVSDWENGAYRLVLKAKDKFDENVESSYYFKLYSSEVHELPYPEFNWFDLSTHEAKPGDTISFVIGTSASNVKVLYELQHKNNVLKSERIKLNNSQTKVEIVITADYVGELDLDLIYVNDNDYYKQHETINVKDPSKEIDIKLETFRSVLQPSVEELWKINIQNLNGENISAEVLCALTDAAIESISANKWTFASSFVNWNYVNWKAENNFENSYSHPLNSIYYGHYYSDINYNDTDFVFKIANLSEMNFSKHGDVMIRGSSSVQAEMSVADMAPADASKIKLSVNEEPPDFKENAPVNPHLKIRKNFNETAFFYTDLQTDKNGNVEVKFTSPESLSRWKFKAFAHTKDVRTAYYEKEIITQKELMLNPNIPRFFRQGDTLLFSTRVSNLTGQHLEGEALLKFYDPVSMTEVSNIILDKAEKGFEVEQKSNVNISWKLIIPDNINALTYRLTAASENHSDGEERMIPVLSNRMLVTESLPIHIDAKAKKNFSFDELLNSDSSQTLRHQSLKLEMCSNPNWYAIQALPHIAKNQKENSIALFNRYYANSMASYILNSSPKIRYIFEQWKNIEPDAFLSELEKNQELKSVLLAETPWLMEAQNENERKRRLGLFFDLNTMKYELESSLEKLMKMQRYNGSWSWYDGGRPSRYITQHILSGLLKLKYRGVISSEDWELLDSNLSQAIKYLNNELRNDFNSLKEREKVILDDDHLTNTQIQYLYALSFVEDLPEWDEEMEKILAYHLDQSQKYWMNKSNLLQGMIAITLHRKGDAETSNLIIRSLKERASLNGEMGMYWKQTSGFYWYQSSIETQALLIEAFSEISNDRNNVKEMKKWLLKQKQTQMWNTAKSSVEAVNALLLDNVSVLNDQSVVHVKLANKAVSPAKTEAGTGYYEVSWTGEDVNPEMGEITVSNSNNTLAWGALHWQYFEDLDQIKSFETPLSIEKELYLKKVVNNEAVLEPITENNPIQVGDKLVSRIVIRSDRDMEFVHLKDMRASAFEPRNVFSTYRYQNGLGYYESTKDAASHFYFDRLNKGTYVFEYEMFATQKGNFSNGITTIQCMYAPEFVSHSKGIRIEVKN